MQWNSIQKALYGLPIPDMRYYPITGSTNEDALAWAANGALEGSLVIADQQTSGRGRQGRKWITKAGTGLAFSFIFKPKKAELNYLQLFSPIGAVAVCQAIQMDYSIKAQVKWPNDVLLDKKKVGGILAESYWLDDQVKALVLGIGINLTPESVPEQSSLRFPATCLETECQHKIDPHTFLSSICSRIFSLRPILGSIDFLRIWDDFLAFKGEGVIIETDEDIKTKGMLKGLDAEGNLILQNYNGNETIYRMGEVRLLPEP